MTTPSAVLLITCPDRPGLVAGVANFVTGYGGNILHADQHVDDAAGIFFQRVEFDLDGFGLARDDIAPTFAPVAEPLGMQYRRGVLRRGPARRGPRVDVRRTASPTCWRAGLRASSRPTCRSSSSNHPDHAATAEFYGVDYEYLPIVDGDRAAAGVVAARRARGSRRSTWWCSPGTCRC